MKTSKGLSSGNSYEIDYVKSKKRNFFFVVFRER